MIALMSPGKVKIGLCQYDVYMTVLLCGGVPLPPREVAGAYLLCTTWNESEQLRKAGYDPCIIRRALAPQQHVSHVDSRRPGQRIPLSY